MRHWKGKADPNSVDNFNAIGKTPARPVALSFSKHELQCALQNSRIVGGQNLPKVRAVSSRRGGDKSIGRCGRAVTGQPIGRAQVHVIRNVEGLKPELDALSLANFECSRQARVDVDGSRSENVIRADVPVGALAARAAGLEVAVGILYWVGIHRRALNWLC